MLLASVHPTILNQHQRHVRACYDVTAMGQGHYSLNLTSQSWCCRCSLPWHSSVSCLGCAAPGASCGSCREPAALQRSKGCVLLADLSLTVRQSAYIYIHTHTHSSFLYYIRLHYTLYHKMDR